MTEGESTTPGLENIDEGLLNHIASFLGGDHKPVFGERGSIVATLKAARENRQTYFQGMLGVMLLNESNQRSDFSYTIPIKHFVSLLFEQLKEGSG